MIGAAVLWGSLAPVVAHKKKKKKRKAFEQLSLPPSQFLVLLLSGYLQDRIITSEHSRNALPCSIPPLRVTIVHLLLLLLLLLVDSFLYIGTCKEMGIDRERLVLAVIHVVV